VPELDPGTIVRVLNKHGVRYAVIGGIAAEIHELPVPATVDIDVTQHAITRTSNAWPARSTNSKPVYTPPRMPEPGSRAHPSSCGRSTTPCT
jgi:hypothetical protein